MLSEQGCRARRKRLWEAVPETVEWVLVADPRHVNYLSAFWVNPLSHSCGERALLHLQRAGETVLLCDNFALASAVGEPVADRVIVQDWYDQRHSVPNRDHVLFAALKSIADRLKGAPGWLESEWLPIAALEELETAAAPQPRGPESLGSILRRLRRCKEPDELRLLERCMRAGEAGHARGRAVVRAGVDELTVYREVQSAAIEALGLPALVYGDFRAATGGDPRAGGPPTGYVLRNGDCFILDFSVVLAGYRSDFTNTLAVGSPSSEQRELMQLCRTALGAGEAALKPGARAREVYRAVAAVLAEAGRPGVFPHHAGHGLGLGHPEAPAFVPESEEVLGSGEVVTLEPGAYAAGVGGVRIEHNYRITGSGRQRLSQHEIGL